MHVVKWILLPVALSWAGAAFAQNYPVRPVRIIVPFSPGGATDVVTRIVSVRLTEIWGQSIVVDNRAGAGGNIGADLAAKATPDGYTLFMPSGSVMTANQHMYRKLPFDAEKDFVAVTNVAGGPQVIAVASKTAAKNLKELIALAKAKPGAITFGSAGIGTQTHLAAENFLYTARIEATHVPYKGEGPAIQELIGGQIQMLTPNLGASIGFVKAGRIRALAVTSRSRSPQLPDVPAAAETLPGFENLGWFGLVAPRGTPKAVIAKVHRDVVQVLGSADVKKRFDDIGMFAIGNTPAEFTKAMKEESARWAKVIKERNLQLK
jgi:tripartite-type tricarboxylate transporter receptor subunit TctC